MFKLSHLLGVCGWHKNTSSFLQKNCGFQFGFGFTELIAVSIFFQFSFLHRVLFNQ